MVQGWKVSFPWEVKTWHKSIHRTVIGIGKESLHSGMIFNVFPLILSDYIPTNIFPILSISRGDSKRTSLPMCITSK